MNFCIDIQHACVEPSPVSDEALKLWAKTALSPFRPTAELTLRLVDPLEIIKLNQEYRQINKVTNVLAFPATYPPHVVLKYPLLGDVILCPQVIQEESIALSTPLNAHWAHLVIHGVLHLLGYDHIQDADTKVMQAIEIERLAALQFPNPYEDPLWTKSM
ncbi:MAG: rRNA maturation RNase YbeY [Legionellales bacterium]|nr:rRNA maturation RNase YbeY [Legionellales bacterium]